MSKGAGHGSGQAGPVDTVERARAAARCAVNYTAGGVVSIFVFFFGVVFYTGGAVFDVSFWILLTSVTSVVFFWTVFMLEMARLGDLHDGEIREAEKSAASGSASGGGG